MNHYELALLRELKKLPVIVRVVHPKTVWHFRRVYLGMGMVIGGATMATSYHVVAPVFMPHFLWDAIAYGVHGVGLAAIAHKIDKFWDFVSHDEKTEK